MRIQFHITDFNIVIFTLKNKLGSKSVTVRTEILFLDAIAIKITSEFLSLCSKNAFF